MDFAEIGRNVLRAEAEALTLAAERVGNSFAAAVELILSSQGKVVVSGLGKSGIVARKIAATFRSTGTQAVFLHPVEALHGDLGLVAAGDVMIFVSRSGSTQELVRLLPMLRNSSVQIVSVVGQTKSALGEGSDLLLDASIRAEADPNNLAPTSSTVVAMALGDALAVALMSARKFSPNSFAEFHPGGQLGRSLKLKVADAMQSGDRVSWVEPKDSLRSIVIAMTQRPLGAACVIHPGGELAGIITDGDLRRALQKYERIDGLTAADLMTLNPITIHPDASLAAALMLMENRPSQISVLPVVANDGKCLGLLRLHDVYRPESGG